MALINAPPSNSNMDFPVATSLPSSSEVSEPTNVPGVQPSIQMGSVPAPTVNPAISQPGLMRTPSVKVPKGRHLVGDHVVYDVGLRLQGEVQPQLEVTPITKYSSDPQLVVGRQIAVNKSYICYGLRLANIRVIHINTASRFLLRGHSQRVSDMAFFADDVHLLASASIDGRFYVWKISEAPDGQDITGTVVIAIQIVGDGEYVHPRVCWHCHKQEVLVVGMGKYVLRIDTTKVGKGEFYSAEEPLKCQVDKLIDGIQLVGKHDGEVTDLSMCQWMTTRLVSASTDGTIKIWEDRKTLPLVILRPHDGEPVNSATFLTAPHRPEHIILVTAGPLNRQVKIWASAGEGWLLPSDAEWQCTQTLDIMNSSASQVEEAFFNQVVALSQAGLLLLANAKQCAIYAVHLKYGSNPAATRMDYIAEFTVTMPILSFTGMSEISSHGEHNVQVYCFQTQAIQQYALDLSQCLPLPLDNLELEKSTASCEATSAEAFATLEPSGNKPPDIPLARSAHKPTTQISSSEAATMQELINSKVENKSGALLPVINDTDIVSVTSPSLPPSSSQKLSGSKSPSSSFEPAPPQCGGDQSFIDYSVDRQMDTIGTNLTDFQSLDDNSRNEKRITLDATSALRNPSIMFKHPTHLITPSEFLKSVSSSAATNDTDGRIEGETNIRDVVVNRNGGNAEVEVKVVGETRSTQNDEFTSKGEAQNFENKEKFFCSQASDLSIEMANDCCALSVENYIVEEAQVDGASVKGPPSELLNIVDDEVHESTKDESENVADFAIATTVQHSQVPTAKGKMQKGKSSQLSVSSSPPLSVLNSTDLTTIPCTSSSNSPVEAGFSQVLVMQEMLNQLMITQKEMQKQMTMMAGVAVTKEGKRLEVALGRSMEKVVKANVDALWAHFQEENTKNEKLIRDRTTQQITALITNFMSKDLPAIIDKTVKNQLAVAGSAIARTVTSSVEKTISSAIVESFQRGVGDKAVNQLEKSVNSKIEATVARQIQAQFQTSGKLALQDALKSNLEASIIPAFEKACKAMFEQVDATFQKGMVEHTAAAQNHLESTPSTLALALRDALSSATSVSQSLREDLADGQRKLLALAVAGTNSSGVNPLAPQLSNGPLSVLHDKVEAPLDPTKELSRLVSERKYEEAFTGALQRSDVSIVSWLCSKVNLQLVLSMVPLPLSQGVLLSLLQQLACDIHKDTPQKLAWMTDVANAINPSDPMIAMHVRPIFEQVYQILNHHRTLPSIKGPEISSIRLVMHVINSMLMTCK